MELERADIESSMKVGYNTPLIVAWEFGMTKQKGKKTTPDCDRSVLARHRKDRRARFYAERFSSLKKEIDFTVNLPKTTFTKVNCKLIQRMKGKRFV